MEVGGLEAVAVHQAEAADSRACEVADDRDAEAAAADDEHAAGAEFALAAGADFFQRHLAGVVGGGGWGRGGVVMRVVVSRSVAVVMAVRVV